MPRREAAATELNGRIDPTAAPLMRCGYLYGSGDNAPSDLLFAYHHTIMDAASDIQLYHQLLSLCAAAPGDASDDASLRLPPFIRRQMRHEIA